MRLARATLSVLLLWLPFVALWTLFNVIYGQVSIGEAVYGSSLSMTWAAILGAGVWWISGRYPWPDGLRVSFYIAHLALGAIYAAAWVLRGYAHHAVETGDPLLEEIRQSATFGWQLVMGLWLYGLVAGVSYAIRTRRRLRDKERDAARAEALAVRAQVQALRAQLQPHFLFNALHSVTALIRHDSTAAEQAVERLGSLLRYALDQAGDEPVPLEDEWEFTQHYLALEQLRFGDRLQIRDELDIDALDCRVPPFSLQPLVENAIRHGISPRPGPGMVSVSAHVSETSAADDALIIEVRDDGVGCDLEAQNPAETSNRGHGLSTLRKRCNALYGDRASLALESAPGLGFSARLTLPARAEPAAPSQAIQVAPDVQLAQVAGAKSVQDETQP